MFLQRSGAGDCCTSERDWRFYGWSHLQLGARVVHNGNAVLRSFPNILLGRIRRIIFVDPDLVVSISRDGPGLEFSVRQHQEDEHPSQSYGRADVEHSPPLVSGALGVEMLDDKVSE